MKHLFILLMDNGGSRLLQEYILKCEKAVGLSVGEGQQLFGKDGPDMHEPKFSGTFSRYKYILSDPKYYNWDNIVKKWNKDWGEKRDGYVYVEKCPCDLFRVNELATRFENPHFIVGTRHPLAILEGKIRHGISITEAIDHWAELAKRQMDISYSYSYKLRYEDMCNHPDAINLYIKFWIPELYDLNFSQTTNIVSGIRESKNRPLRNMNEEKIGRLSKEQKQQAIDYLSSKYSYLMDFWGYS